MIFIFSIILFQSKTHMKQALLGLLLVSLAAAQCLKGGLTSPQGQCYYPQFIEGCLHYSPNNECLQCQYNYQQNKNKCLYNPSLLSQCCSKFNMEGRCTQCSRGLVLNSQTGLCQDEKIQGCIRKDQRGCVVCARDYDLIGQRCLKSIPNCLSYDGNYKCLSCENGCALANGVCIPRAEISKIQSCRFANEFGCYECFEGYRLTNNGLCVAVEFFGCLRYDSNGRCLRCDAPFYFLSQGKCLITGCLQYQAKQCTQCNSALGFVIASNRCQIPNCLYFGLEGCTACRNNLVAGSFGCRQGNNKVCIICKNDEYLSKNGDCLKKNVHCTQYKNGVCAGCCDRYYLNANNECSPKANGCIYNNGRCESCSAPFAYANGACLIQGCLSYNEDGCTACQPKLVLDQLVCKLPFCRTFSQEFVCTQCLQGYELNSNNQCVQVDAFCQRRNSLNSCITCKPNYTFNAYGRCVSMKVGCNYVDGRCTSCRAPFMYLPESESCFIDGCLEYFIGGCSKCETLYSLLYNSCKLPNCLISKNGKCLECDPDFVFNSRGLCVSKDEFCDKMDQFGTCIKCMNSYFYSLKLQKCVKKAPGCIYNDEDECHKCQSPFTSDNGRCSIVGCLSYISEGCLQCQYPFMLSKDKACYIPYCATVRNNVCVGCQKGYALDNKNLCRIADANCVQFNNMQTKCTKCVKGYRLDQNNRCEYSDQYCNYFDKHGFCVNCDRLYFVNPHAKCQLRDPQCITYTNGYCSKCRPYHFANNGICFANLKGCRDQRAYGDCRACDKGFNLDGRICKAEITKLNWNSIDMDFFEDGDQQSASVFSYNMTNKMSLVQAIRAGKGKVFSSSSSLNNANFQIDTEGSNGWSPSVRNTPEFIGVQTNNVQIFYAFEVKPLAGCQAISFDLEYSFDGIKYETLEHYTLTNYLVDIAKTYYFKPVEAKFIRLVLRQGKAHFKLEFYYSNTNYVSTAIQTKSHISKTVTEIIDGVQGGISTCEDSKLCWAGVEACEPTKLLGFQLIYTADPSKNFVKQVKIDYSLDGMKFTCFDNCKALSLKGNKVVFDNPILTQKVHVHFTSYEGNPKFGIKFNWAL